MNPEIQAILSGHNLPPSTPLNALPAHLTGDELSRVHHLLKYPNEQTEPKGGRMMVSNTLDQRINACNGNIKQLKIIIDGMSKNEKEYRINNFFFTDLDYDQHDKIIKALKGGER